VDLHRDYAKECAIAGLPPPDEKLAAYGAIAQSGVFTAYGAFVDGLLAGFMAVLTPVIPHYGVSITVAESLFVGAAFRSSGAGLALIRAGERHARDAGSPGLLLSAPSGGRLALVLPKMGYRETSRVFFKGMSNG
ncbi:MAG: hypothetical protein RBR34_11015, partial [Rhodospirillaceae bacterium]|nr:hypothetical protein [Rhodospirillaceae bacterium]